MALAGSFTSQGLTLLFRGFCLTCGTYSLNHNLWNKRLGVRERGGEVQANGAVRSPPSDAGRALLCLKSSTLELFKGVRHELVSE